MPKTKPLDIGPGLPDHLKFLYDVPPVPVGAHQKCAGSGRCQTMFMGGVTCGALFSTCALLPMESKATKETKGVKSKETVGPGFDVFIQGVKSRHPEFFGASMDHKEAAAGGDDWDGIEIEGGVE